MHNYTNLQSAVVSDTIALFVKAGILEQRSANIVTAEEVISSFVKAGIIQRNSVDINTIKDTPCFPILFTEPDKALDQKKVVDTIKEANLFLDGLQANAHQIESELKRILGIRHVINSFNGCYQFDIELDFSKLDTSFYPDPSAPKLPIPNSPKGLQQLTLARGLQGIASEESRLTDDSITQFCFRVHDPEAFLAQLQKIEPIALAATELSRFR